MNTLRLMISHMRGSDNLPVDENESRKHILLELQPTTVPVDENGSLNEAIMNPVKYQNFSVYGEESQGGSDKSTTNDLYASLRQDLFLKTSDKATSDTEDVVGQS
jgi:hypothetical protein